MLLYKCAITIMKQDTIYIILAQTYKLQRRKL